MQSVKPEAFPNLKSLEEAGLLRSPLSRIG